MAIVAAASIAAVTTSLAATAPGCGAPAWVSAWTAPAQSSSFDRPNGLDDLPRRFRDQTVRIRVSPRYAGDAVRVTLGNRFGTGPVSVAAATVARAADGASLAAGSVRPLTFGGSSTVTVPAGRSVTSDPIGYGVTPFEPLAVSFHVAGEVALDVHQWAITTNHLTRPGSGDHTGDVSGDAFGEELTSSLLVSAVDVLARDKVGAVVTLGDSITDGIGSTLGADQRWPDHLSRRLLASGRALSVVNAGMGGNHVATDGRIYPRAIGAAARQRVAWDALDAEGITDLVVFEGINDVTAASGTGTPELVISGYREIIDAARDRGVRVIGATITPAGLTGTQETARLKINRWIRTSGEFDAVLDFDRVIRDPGQWSRVRPEHDAGFAHLTDEAYGRLASSIDLGVFRGAGCG